MQSKPRATPVLNQLNRPCGLSVLLLASSHSEDKQVTEAG